MDNAIFVGRTFDQAQRCRADANDPSAARLDGIQPVGGFPRHMADLEMHLVVVGIV